MSDVNYDKVCRLCLGVDGGTIPIFSSGNDGQLAVDNLASTINACVSVEIQEQDRLTTQICKPCSEKVVTWAKFKEVCDDSQTKLREWISRVSQPRISYPVVVKEELIELDELQPETLPSESEHDTSLQHHFDPNVSIKLEINNEFPKISAIRGEYMEPAPAAVAVIEHDELPPALEAEGPAFLSSLGLHPTSGGNVRDKDSTDTPETAPPVFIPLHLQEVYPMDTADSMDSTDGERSIQVHRRNGKWKSPSQCRHCGIKFANRGNARRHEKNIHDKVGSEWQPNPLNPTILQKATKQDDSDNEESLDKDMRKPASVELTPDKIEYITKHRELLEQLHSLVCYCCNITFKNIGSITNHLRKKLEGVPLFQCFYCMLSFPGHTELMVHRRERLCVNLWELYKKDTRHNTIEQVMESRELVIMEQEIAPDQIIPPQSLSIETIQRVPLKNALAARVFGCNFCDVQKRIKLDIKKHIIYSHIREKSDNILECNYCNVLFEDAAKRKRHNTNADCTTYVQCEMCSDRFISLQPFYDHATAEHALAMLNYSSVEEVNNELPVKRQKYRNKSEINHVAHTSTPEKEAVLNKNLPTSCHLCTRSYASYYNLVRHMKNNHSGAIPFVSEYVDKQTAQSKKSGNKHDATNIEGIEMDAEYNYSCKECGVLFKTVDEWTSHQQMHNGCEQCGLVFSTEMDLEIHKKEHLKMKLYTCNVCHNTYSNSTRLAEHITTHETITTTKYNSEVLMVTTQNYNDSAIKGHLKRDSKIQKQVMKEQAVVDGGFKCNFCQKVLSTSQGLFRHMLFTHKTKTSISGLTGGYKCEDCGNSYASRRNMYRHKQRCNKNKQRPISVTKFYKTALPNAVRNPLSMKLLQCEHCEVKVRNKDDLNRHKLEVHYPAGSKICNICGHVVTSSKKMWYHKRKYHPQSVVTVSCKICAKKFSNKVNLFRHIKVAHLNESLVESMNELQQSQDEMPVLMNTEYIETKTDMKPRSNLNEEMQHSCTVCNRQFLTLNGLSKHKLVHKKTKPAEVFLNPYNEEIQCDICYKMFKSTGAMKSHRGWHLRSASGKSQTDTPNEPWRPGQISPSRVQASVKRLKNVIPMADSTNSKVHALNAEVDMKLITNKKSLPLQKAENKYCSACNITLKTVSHYKRHLLEVHRPVKARIVNAGGTGVLSSLVNEALSKQRCMSCKLNFKTFAEWIEHRLEHTRETMNANDIKIWVCDCGKQFHRKDHLRSHYKTHITKPEYGEGIFPEKFYTCNLCRVSFRSSKELRQHVATHDKETGGPSRHTYKCDFCGFMTEDIKQYQECRKMHHVPTKYKCTACKIYFKTSDTLQRHKAEQHTDTLMVDESQLVKTYACTQCDRTYTLRHHLKRHVDSAH